MRNRIAWILALLLVGGAAACDKGEPAAGSEGAGESEETATAEATEATEGDEEAAGDEAAEGGAAAAEDDEPVEDSFENGVYTSPRFNVRFNVPASWSLLEAGDGSGDTGPAGLGTSDDSVTIVGPEETGIRLVLAGTDSVQLVDNSFTNLDERVGFTNVNILPEKREARTFNGVPGYRTEGDALLRGEGVPVYFIAQALELPTGPVMLTIFVPGDNYFEHSDTMKAVLDSVEPLDLRPE